jgi:hypothetical protein
MISNSLLKLLLFSKAMVDQRLRSWTFDLRAAVIWQAKFQARSASSRCANLFDGFSERSRASLGCGCIAELILSRHVR